MQTKKIFHLTLIFILFISCVKGKGDKNNQIPLFVLLNQDSSQETEKENFIKPKPFEPVPLPSLNIQDEFYKNQWYLKNTGQYGGKTGIDINVEPVWKQGYNGQDVFIGMLDGLVQASNPDLKDNVPAENIIKYNNDSICTPEINKHGTGIAGLMVARDNTIGIRGIAFRSTLYSYAVTVVPKNTQKLSQNIVHAFQRSEHKKIAVYNGSIGTGYPGLYEPITDDLYQSIEKITKEGFYGEGSILVFSAGNGDLLLLLGNSSVEAWLSNHYAVIAVNSIQNTGERVTRLGGQGGVNLWLVGPTKITRTQSKMYTTNPICPNKTEPYSDAMSSTSGATPMVTGVVALLRQAYPDLSWRDVKLILAESAKKITGGGQSYQKTGKMYSNPQKEQKHGRYTGFGLIDAGAAFKMAKNWKPLPPMKEVSGTQRRALDTTIKDQPHESTLSIDSNDLSFIESVTLEMEISKSKEEITVKQFDLILISPDGTESYFFKANGEKTDVQYIFQDSLQIKPGVNKLTFISNSFLGNSTISGNWRLKIKQNNVTNNNDQKITEIKSWKLTIRGH